MSKVFVIDDSVSVCVAIERMLGEHGFDVVWERDAVTALSTVEKHVPDLIICDLVLPEIDGYEICRSLRANPLLGRVPVVLISGAVDEDVRMRARDADAAAIIAKPFTADRLVDTVQSVLSALEPSMFHGGPRARPTLLYERMAAELERFAVLGCRYCCVLDTDAEVVAATGAAKPGVIGTDTARELRGLAALVADADSESGDAPLTRLTLEREGGVLIVDPLDKGYLLVVSLADARLLGKARFVTRRLRSWLTRLLGD